MVKYYYDGNGNLVKQATQSNVLGTTEPTFDVVEYTYDEHNNVVKSVQYANGGTLWGRRNTLGTGQEHFGDGAVFVTKLPLSPFFF